jgi:hypothetical protein
LTTYKVDPMYLIKLKDGTTRLLSIEQFQGIFGVPGHNFETRLEQLRYFYLDAIDWEMVER